MPSRSSIQQFVAACLLCPALASGQLTARIRTAQTSVRLEAAEQAPRLVGLQGGDSDNWSNGEQEQLLPYAWVGQQKVALHWQLVDAASTAAQDTARFVYESAPLRLRLTWIWQARASTGPIEHRIQIENLSHESIWIPLQDSFRFSWGLPQGQALTSMYIDKGAGKPTHIGTHLQSLAVGYSWEGQSSTYAADGLPREIIPFLMVENAGTRSGWYMGIEFSGRTRIALQREAATLNGVLGLNPAPGPFRTHLAPGESFETPTVFVGAFQGGPDGLGNVLRPWIRQVLANPRTWQNPAYPLLVNNSWGSAMAINEAIAHRMIRDSAELGLEMFHLDAGWFRGVGDWYPDPQKFPHGLAALADDAHAHGLKFGLWVDWAQAGADSSPGALNAHDPRVRDWLIADVPANWKPDEFVGRTTDLGDPAVHAYASREVQRIVHDYKLDMLEHDGYVVTKGCVRRDHPHAPPASSVTEVPSGSGIALPLDTNSTDVSYHSVHSYYGIYAHLRRLNPDLLLEICDDGGRMVDFGSAAHGDYFSITDSYDPLSNRQAFYDASHVLPAAMLEDYEMKWPVPRIENFRYMLRSGMMGWLTVMQDTTAWTPEEHASAKRDFALYKQFLRPLIRDADLYHISPRPDGVHWDGIEYFDPKTTRGAVYAFRGSAPDEEAHSFPLYGVAPDRSYRLHFHDGSAPDRTVTGRELLRSGLPLRLPVPDSSEIVLLSEVR